MALALVPVLLLGGDEKGEPRPAADPLEERALPPLRSGTMVAAGEAPVAGRWRMLTYESERLADPESGEEYQPAGLPCLGLALLDSPAASSVTFGGQCGDFPRTPGFSRVQQPCATAM